MFTHCKRICITSYMQGQRRNIEERTKNCNIPIVNILQQQTSIKNCICQGSGHMNGKTVQKESTIIRNRKHILQN